jgi:hypothetical protein
MIKYFNLLTLSLSIVLLIIHGACTSPGTYSVKGTVSAIQRGKDGYTATLTNKGGHQFEAVISRVNMANTAEYQELEVGDQVTVTGDTTRLGDRINIKVTQIKK